MPVTLKHAPRALALASRQPGSVRAPLARSPLRVLAFATPAAAVAVEGPGTGNRHYPAELRQSLDVRRRAPGEQHDMMSTETCYELFPLVTHISCPLKIEDREPAGISAQRVGDAGPTTGHRRRPAPASVPAQRQVLPYPSGRPADLRREVIARHAPELLLAQQQMRQQRRPEA